MKPLTWSGTPRTNISTSQSSKERDRSHVEQPKLILDIPMLSIIQNTSHNFNNLLPQQMVCVQLAGWLSQSSPCSQPWDLPHIGKAEILEKATENYEDKWRKINRRLLPPTVFYIFFIPNNSVAEVHSGVHLLEWNSLMDNISTKQYNSQ